MLPLSFPSSAHPCHPTTASALCHCSSSSKMQTNLIKLLLLLTIFFYFSYLLSASAVPLTRTQNLKGEEQEFSAMPSSTRLENGFGNDEEVVVVDMKEELIERRRVYLETQDYEGTGANKDHEPKSPGGV